MKKSTVLVALAALATIPMNAEVVYTFDTPQSLGNWGNIVEVPEKAFATAKEGSVIKINLELAADEINDESPAQVQLAVKTVESWNWTQIVDCADVVGTSYSYTVLDACPSGCDDTDLEMLKAHGLNIKGQHASVVSIEINNEGAAPEPEMDWTSVWKAGADAVPFGAWTNIVEIPESVFASAKEGTVVKIMFTGMEGATEDSPAQVQLALKSVEAWNWTQIVDCDDIVGDSYTFELKDEVVGSADDTDLEMIKAHGLYMKGQNATPSEILLSGEGAGIENVAIDMNAPVEIYTIDGRRVNEASNGLYIFRQGKNVRKVIVR